MDIARDRVCRNRVWQSKIREQFVIGELKQSHIELHKRAHHLIVHVKWQSLVELVWLDPCDLLAHYLYSVINALYGEESLGKALRKCTI